LKKQIILKQDNKYQQLFKCFRNNEINNILIVCGKHCQKLIVFQNIKELCEEDNISMYIFDEFQANPKYEAVCNGVKLFRENNCKAIIAIGGGSAMDVAKCIKMFCYMDETEHFFKQKILSNEVLLAAIPTTAGTGAESTRFAVIYYEGEKLSVSDDCGLPDVVILETSSLKELSEYQRKVTALDALAHGIESYWSANSTEESRNLSKDTISGFFLFYKGYLLNQEKENREMLLVANMAGRAINITQTTAAHAMSYKISSMYDIAHGHAVGICLPIVLKYMISHMNKCCDIRGKDFLESTFREIAYAAGCNDIECTANKLEQLIVKELQLEIPKLNNYTELEQLYQSVNYERLKNNPIRLEVSDLIEIYQDIFNEKRG